MPLPIFAGASSPFRSIKLFCATAGLIGVAGCSSGIDTNAEGEFLSAAVATETLRVSLEPEATYQWRVRAISETVPGPWSAKFLVQPDADSEVLFDVSLPGANTLAEDAFADALLNDSPEQTIADAFYDLLFVDSEEPTEDGSLLDDDSNTSVIPLFTWEQDGHAAAYEIEIANANTFERLGVFQYEESALCTDGVCELILENSVEATLDLPPIPLIGHTFVQGEAPYWVVLPSPVLDPAGLEGYSHLWSIEGQFIEFADVPEFRFTFAEAGSHNINVLVTAPDGRSDFASATVEVSKMDMTFSGGSSEAEQAGVSDVIDPDLSAALPESTEVDANKGASGTGEGSVEGALSVPEVSVRDLGPATEATPEEESVELLAQAPAVELPEEGVSESESEVSAESETPELSENAGGSDVDTDTANGQPGQVADIIDLEDAQSLVFDNDLPMGGIFYGHPGSGWKTANAPLSIQSARRFMAERSGNIVSVRHENRTLSDSTISSRCKSSDPDSIWCKCKNANLDKYTCGYTLSNSYSVGNGGSILVEVRADDGSDEHLPSDVVLGSAVNPYVPMETEHYPEIALEAPVAIEAGKIYHLVYRNINPPTSCSLRSVSHSEAKSCPRNQGAMGLNGVNHHVDIGPTARFGPFLSESPAVLYRSKSSSSWRTHDYVTSWFEIKYDDNVWVGDSMVAYDSRTSVGSKTIEGNTHGRQVFTVTDASRIVDGVWLNYGHKSHANGKELQLELKSSNGTVLANGKIPRSEDCMPVIKNAEDSFESGCRVWGHAEFSSPAELVLGSTYSLELSAPSGAGFIVATYFTLTHYGSSNRNHWNDAQAELSTDGGDDWESWADKFRERDIPVLFTIQGQPRQIR